MEYLALAGGVQMPMLGYGTWQLRGDAGRRSIRQALEVGYRLLDTARMYENEEIVGQAVRESGLDREEIFLTTKLCRTSAGYEKARRDIDASLRALGTDYADLVLIHEPYEEAPAMYRALQEARREGKVRAIGVSNFTWEEYERLARLCGEAPAVNQVESHVYFPRLELKQKLESKQGKIAVKYDRGGNGADRPAGRGPLPVRLGLKTG